MKTTFVPKPEQKPALPKFGDLVVGQGFRFEAGGPIFIKIDETPSPPELRGCRYLAGLRLRRRGKGGSRRPRTAGALT